MAETTNRRRKGLGSITQRERKRWVGHITIEGRRQYFSGTTEKEVSTKLRDAMVAHERGEPLVDRRVSVARFLDEWLEGPAKQRLRETTWSAYRTYVRRFLIPGLGTYKLAQLQPEHIDTFLAGLRSTRKGAAKRPVSARTQTQIRAILRSALTWGEQRGRVARNVAKLSTPPRVLRFEIQPLTIQECQQLVAAAAEHPLGALFVLALDTGARQGELLGLRWGDVDLEDSEPKVRFVQNLQRVSRKTLIQEPKTQSGRRTVGLTGATVALLRTRRARQAGHQLKAGKAWRNRAGLAFTNELGEPLVASTVTYAFQRFLAANGLPKLRFHDLRHTSASYLLSQGMAAKVVSERLGHANINVTLNVYGHLAQELQQEATAKMAELLSG